MAINRATVSQLAEACVSPDFLEALKSDPAARVAWQPWLVESPDGAPAPGRLFHELVARFTDWLVQGGRTTPSRERLTSTQALWDAFFDRLARKRLEELADRQQPEAASNLSLALRNWCDRLATIRAEVPHAASWRDIFVASEYGLEDVPVRVADDTIYINGRIDALRASGETLEIVDYKLSKGQKLESDALQMALYAHLLRVSPHGLRVGAAIEYYEPELCVVRFSSDELEEIFTRKVAPVLETVMTAWQERGQVATGTAVGTEPQRSEPRYEETARAIENCYATFNLNVSVVDWTESPQLVRFHLKPAPGVKVISLANRKADLQVQLGSPTAPRVQHGPGAVYIDLPKEKPDTVGWRDLIRQMESDPDHSPVAFPIGKDIHSRTVIGDFCQSNTAHGLIGGVAGSGKSELLKAIVAALIHRNAISTLRLTLIDPKQLSFGALKGSPYLTHSILTGMEASIGALHEAVEEMDRRYRILEEEGMNSLTERYAAGKRDIPFRVIVVDEFADLVLAGKDQSKEFESVVARLAAKGRASGIHLLLATQRPDAKVVSPQIKANLPLKICLRVTSGTNSQIILEEPGAEDLLGRGDLLCDRGRGIERAQAPILQKEDLAALCRKG